jgi:hypothetical protein
MALASSAQQLDSARSAMLQSLFPNLQSLQAGDIKMTSGILQQANDLAPEVGLTGRDIAELWKARVGAYAQGTQDLGNAKAAGVKNTTGAIGDLIGKVGQAVDTSRWNPFASTTRNYDPFVPWE